MSMRDIAAALGSSTGELSRWMALAELGEKEFEFRTSVATRAQMSAAGILAMGTPVPARGRVERAFAIYKGMTPAERGDFLAIIGGASWN
jgi:hypothetical protein